MDHNSTSISNIIGSLNVLNIVFNSKKFIEWVNKNHPLISIDEIYPGYRFFLESAIGMFTVAIEMASVLKIAEDYVYFRAHFVGVPLNKFPVTCEKTAILKNINENLKLIRGSKNFENLDRNIVKFSDKILSPFLLIMNDHCVHRPELSFDEGLKFSTMWITHIYLSDFSKWVPMGYLLSPFSLPKTWKKKKPYFFKNELQKEFTGYKITLQYLWYCLLGEGFEKTSLININKATDWTITPKYHRLFGNKPSDDKNRTDLDRFFPLIQDEIITPIEQKYDFIYLNNIFSLNETYSKNILKPLLLFEENLSLNIKERLDFIFLWYDLELLDASKNEIFNGTPAFNVLLSGSAELKLKYANGDRAIICKFVHPGNSKNNEYSYGVLVEVNTNTGFSDYSGWIIFYNCCNDFTGFSGSGHRISERLIKEYSEKDVVYLREMNIKKTELKKYLEEKANTGKNKEIFSLEIELKEKKRELSENKADSKGILHEFMTYYTLLKRNEGLVDWNVVIDNNQLDITCENEDSYRLIECKVDPKNMNLKSEIEKIIKKLVNIQTKKNKIGQFWFYYPPSPDFDIFFNKLKRRYSKNGILIDEYEVLERIIQQDKNWVVKKKDKIKNIFNESD